MIFPKSNYTYCEHESIDELASPSADFWPIYSWCWSDKITEEGIASRLDDMCERGIKRLYVLPIPKEFTGIECEEETCYLSDEYLHLIEYLVNEAKKRGMKLWLYDEGGYPSGAANGRVVNENPHLVSLSINSEGQVLKSATSAQPYPDLLKSDSTEKFIEYTHERYKSYFGSSFAEHFPAIFTDESRVPLFRKTIPWNDELEEAFRQRFGYDIKDNFTALFDENLLDEHSRTVRADYHQLIGELFSENYFGKIKEWCEQNGILSTGHVGGDDVAFGNAKWGYYNIFRCLRQMHIPGIDVIWRQLFPGPKMKGIEPYAPLCANTPFPRYASSCAHQTGSRLSLTESYAIYGAGVTYDQMRWVYNFQVVRGINLLNPMSICYTHKEKYGATAGLPNFSSPVPGCGDLKIFNLWASRVSYLMSAGKPIVDSALYMPLRDIWPADAIARKTAEDFEELATLLDSQGCDTDFIDDDAILAAEIENGALRIGDATYRTVYFQPDINLSEAVKEKLDCFRKSGGKTVLCSGEYEINPIIIDEDKNLRATRRTVSEGVIYYLTNEAFEAKAGDVYFPAESAETAYEINLLTAERKAVCTNPYRYDLSLGGETVLLFGSDVPNAEEKSSSVEENTIELCDFTLQAKSRIEIKKEGIVKCALQSQAKKVPLGDWREHLGEYFSGDVDYKTSFAFPDKIPKKATLKLPKVNYSAEVFLNGKSMGTRIFSPFVYDLAGLKRENELVIRVSNTMANAYAGVDYTEWIPDYEPDYMKKLELEFEKESLESGLLSPVLILY